MKKYGLITASVAAASAMSISSSSPLNSSSYARNPCMQKYHQGDLDNSSSVKSSSTDKYTPRFDGLRFIETLVTAHR